MSLPYESSNLNSRMVRGFTWVAIERWTKRLLNMAVVAILARLLDRADFGLVAAAAILVDYFSTFVGQGLGLAIIQRKDLEPEHLNAMFLLNMTPAVLLTCMIWLFASYLSAWINSPDAASVLRWLSLALVLRAFSRVQTALLTRQMRFEALACINVLSSFAGGATGLTAAFMGFGVWSLVAQQLAGAVFNIFALFFVSDWLPGTAVSKKHIRQLYGFSIYVFLGQQVLFIHRRLDEALVAAFSGVGGLGLYSIAKRIVLLLQDTIEGPLSMTFIPSFSRLQTSSNQLTRTGELSFRISCLLVLPFFVGLIALAPEAVNIIFGPRWEEAIPYVRILAAGSVFIVFHIVIHSIFLALGKPRLNLVVNSGRAVLSTVLLPMGAFFGSLGIPVALALQNMLGAVLALLIFRRKIKGVFIRFMPGFWSPVLASVLMALAVRLTADAFKAWNTVWAAGTGILTGIVVYTLLILLMDRALFLECLVAAKEAYRPGFARLKRLVTAR